MRHGAAARLFFASEERIRGEGRRNPQTHEIHVDRIRPETALKPFAQKLKEFHMRGKGVCAGMGGLKGSIKGPVRCKHTLKMNCVKKREAKC